MIRVRRPRPVMLVVAGLVAVNAAMAVLAFVFAGFATAPDDPDVTMRVGYFVTWGLVFLSWAGVVAPFPLALARRARWAVAVAALPAVAGLLAVAAFLLLDGWLRRTFPG